MVSIRQNKIGQFVRKQKYGALTRSTFDERIWNEIGIDRKRNYVLQLSLYELCQFIEMRMNSHAVKCPTNQY